MDLIYTDAVGQDIGVISNYILDLAYGSDENDFELTIPEGGPMMTADGRIYIIGTEYGGIVDGIGRDSEEGQTVYTGRTFHGVLENKVLCPDGDYLILSGDANTVIARVIALLDVTDIFEAETQACGIVIQNYRVPRYVKGYTALKNMLESYGAKLLFEVTENGKVKLSATYYCNYYASGEMEDSEMKYSITKNYNKVNHLICLGQGELSKRNVIHLFLDGNGTVQPYAKTDDPLQDGDYILDLRHQVLRGAKEIVEVYDYSSAETVENYLPVLARPTDWKDTYMDYYWLDEDGYKEFEVTTADEYHLLLYCPGDWETNYSAYYQKKGEDYDSVEGTEETEAYAILHIKPADWESSYEDYYLPSGSGYRSVSSDDAPLPRYELLQNMPADWGTNWENYYYWYSDGVTGEYKTTESRSVDRYEYHTTKPTDWEENYSSYYQRVGNEWKSVEGVERKIKSGGKVQTITDPPKWSGQMGYATKYEDRYAPDWQPGYYYAYIENSAPEWQDNKFYALYTIPSGAPKWEAGKYYELKQNVEQIPNFGTQVVYRKVEDHYATLVEGGLEKLAEAGGDELDADLDTAMKYDIGDIVGCTDEVTGITVAEAVTKKIVVVDSIEGITVEYKTGGR